MLNSKTSVSRQANTSTASLAWWREARFGMFIHWGIYSATEGYWNNVETKGIGEWIQNRETHKPTNK